MAVHIGIGFKSRMKNTASKKKTCLGFLLILFLAYVVCYLLSQTVFHEIYLFEWTAAHYYLCVWVASVTFCFLEMYRAALITTAGNWTGILIGQVLGDFIIKINATKITPDMYIGKGKYIKATELMEKAPLPTNDFDNLKKLSTLYNLNRKSKNYVKALNFADSIIQLNKKINYSKEHDNLNDIQRNLKAKSYTWLEDCCYYRC